MKYKLNGKSPKHPESCFIAQSADLIGDVELAENVSIWFQTVLRADNDKITIGSNTNIQDASVIHVDAEHPVHIGENVTVGHKVMLHGCTIGNNSLIGMGAIILNGAQIGNNCIIGAGALVTENKIIEDNSIVMGSPAKVVKQVSAEQAEMLKLSAKHYSDKIKEYINLVPVE